MKQTALSRLLALGLTLAILAGCSGGSPSTSSSAASNSADNAADSAQGTSNVASSSQMVTPTQVVEDWMEPISGSSLKDGVYSVTVDSSSSMFNITSCELTVEGGTMTGKMTMGGTGYLYVYMGSAEEASQADSSDYIAFEENGEGQHTFTIPVEALDAGINCAAFSKSKELWYDRTLVFRSDSLPMDAFADGVITTVDSLGLGDGIYTVEVSLSGGSGKASVESPAEMTVENGTATARIVWSSPNYDYVKVDGVQYDPVNTEGNSAFDLPVLGFDYSMPVAADTTAMSVPHEIDYTLYFDSSTIQAK